MSSRAIRPGTAGGGAGAAAVAAGPDPDSLPGPARPAALVALLTLAAFAVPLLGPPLALHGTGEAAAPGAGGIAVLRAVVFAALCVPAGEAFTAWLAHRVPGAPMRPPPSRVAPAATAGFLAALGLACVVSAGNLIPHRLADLDTAGLYRTRDGVLALIEVNAFLLALLWTRARHAAARLVPPAAVVAAEALRAHPATEPSALLGSALTAVHLTCAVLWVGGLWQVLRTVRSWRTRPGPHASARPGPAAGAALLAAYARRAVVLLAALSLTGAVSAVRRMPPSTVLGQLVTTAYGRALLAKLLLVAVAAALALTARSRLQAALLSTRATARVRGLPHMSEHGPLDAADALGPARAEVVVLGAVVAVSALLTALPMPIRW